MTVEEAVDIVAHHAVAHAVEDVIPEAWDMYPELGEYDWSAVQDRAAELSPYPDKAQYETAYALLEARAEDKSE